MPGAGEIRLIPKSRPKNKVQPGQGVQQLAEQILTLLIQLLNAADVIEKSGKFRQLCAIP